MWPWLSDLFSSPEGSALTLVGTLVSTIVTAILRARAIAAREERAMQAIPPTTSTSPTTPFVVQESNITLIDELQINLRREKCWREELEDQIKELGRDQARMAAALTSERREKEALAQLVRELQLRLNEIDSGFTRVVLPQKMPMDLPETVVEVDERPTARPPPRKMD